MDNQKSTEGKGSDASREGAGSSIGKSQNSGLNQGSGASGSSQSASSSSLGSTNASPSTAKPATGSSSGAVGGSSNAGSLQSGAQGSGNLGSTGSQASSAAGSSGSLGSTSGGNSALGSTGSASGSAGSTSGSMGGASAQSSDSSGDQSQSSNGGIKAAMANVSPDKLHQKIDQVAQGAQPLVDRLVSTAHAGVDRLSGMLSGASDSLGQRKGQLNDTYQNYSAKSTEYVKTNPGTALLVAAGVGFLLAKLLGGSSSSDRRYYRDYRD